MSWKLITFELFVAVTDFAVSPVTVTTSLYKLYSVSSPNVNVFGVVSFTSPRVNHPSTEAESTLAYFLVSFSSELTSPDSSYNLCPLPPIRFRQFSNIFIVVSSAASNLSLTYIVLRFEHPANIFVTVTLFLTSKVLRFSSVKFAQFANASSIFVTFLVSILSKLMSVKLIQFLNILDIFSTSTVLNLDKSSFSKLIQFSNMLSIFTTSLVSNRDISTLSSASKLLNIRDDSEFNFTYEALA